MYLKSPSDWRKKSLINRNDYCCDAFNERGNELGQSLRESPNLLI